MLSADPLTSDVVVTEPAADASVDDTTLVATPLIDVTPDAAAQITPSGYSPSQIKQAYGFNLVSGNGAGTTIAIVDAYNNPNIVADLKAFDAQFGIADPPKFTVVSQTGSTTALPANNRGWSLEIALDVEWAHAIAPGANILLVEAKSASLTDLMAAEDYARNAAGVVVVSNSWGASEFSTETSYDKHFVTPAGHQGVSFMVAAGDDGTPAEYPSSSPNVLSVGGTTLKLVNGVYSSETVWSDGGGGASRYEAKPTFQANVNTGGTHRGTPDVSLDADPSTGFAVYDTYGASGWVKVGGTSASTPVWAALVAIADGSRLAAGKDSLSNVQTALYSLSSSDFHDITKGSNGVTAKAGYDLASGLGSPYANLVIRDLITYSGGTTFTATTAQPVQMVDWSWLWSFFGAVQTDGGGDDVAGALAAEFTNSATSSIANVAAPQLSSGNTVASFVTSSVASIASVTPVAAPVAMKATIPFGSRFDVDEAEFETWLSDTWLNDVEREYLASLAAFTSDENAIAETF